MSWKEKRRNPPLGHVNCRYLVKTPSPGSIFAYLAVTPRGGHFAVLGGVLIGAVGSAVVGTLILKARPIKETDSGVEEAIEVNVPTAE